MAQVKVWGTRDLEPEAYNGYALSFSYSVQQALSDCVWNVQDLNKKRELKLRLRAYSLVIKMFVKTIQLKSARFASRNAG
jgi:hypothetical protein